MTKTLLTQSDRPVAAVAATAAENVGSHYGISQVVANSRRSIYLYGTTTDRHIYHVCYNRLVLHQINRHFYISGLKKSQNK